MQTSQEANQAGAYPSYCSTKQKEYFYSPLDWMLVHHTVTPNIKFAATHFYTWVERGTVRVVSLPRTQYNVPGQDLNLDWVQHTYHEAATPSLANQSLHYIGYKHKPDKNWL